MTERDDHELLAEYTCTGSEAAFGALVARYVNLVHSTAWRFTRNPHHAEEITQAVFIILARKAGGLRRGMVLPGWLYQTARLTAANFVKGEIRRQLREQEACMQSTLTDPEPAAWEQIAPLLDEAMGQLGETDRNAIVLRFFENKTVPEVAATLKLNEAAAHKRMSRAVDKLRKLFNKRGVTLTVTVIAGVVAANSVQAAPVALAKSVTAIAMTKGVAASSSTLTLMKGALKIMAWTKAKTAIVIGAGMLLAAGTTTVVVEKYIAAKQYAVAQEPWSDVGAATPGAALQSLAWALAHDQFGRAQELVQWDEKGLAYGGDTTIQHQVTLMSILAPALKDIESFRILTITSTQQPDEVIVKIEKTFKNRRIVPFAVTAKLRRVGGQWRAVGNIEYFEGGSVSMLLPFTGSF